MPAKSTDAKPRTVPRKSPKKPSSRKTEATATPEHALAIAEGLRQEYGDAECALIHKNAFQLIIATILSAQCTDERVNMVTPTLFARWPTPKALADAPLEEIEKVIQSTGFFRAKAKSIKGCCQKLVSDFDGKVPKTLDEMVTLPGVGRKTANLVLILGFKSRGHICVDTHVHRISNRLGWVETREPEETEQALYRATAQRWWPLINLYMVTWGQNVCRPIGPRCGDCAISADCPKIGVEPRRSR
jgi:endonuclease-3